MKKKRFLPMLIYALIMFVVMSWTGGLFGQDEYPFSYSEVVNLFRQEQVESFYVRDDTITMILYEPYLGHTEVTTGVGDAESFRREMWDLIQKQSDSGVLKSYTFYATQQWSPYELVLPMLLVGVVLLFLWMIMMGRINSNNPLQNFGKARTVLGLPDNKKVTFADVAGADEEKQELAEVVDFLKNPAKYTAIGARIPHGILLVGPPGTGKTLLARAVAGEAGVPFLSISGSDFVEMYVGVGASRVRDLFEQAKRVAPAIVFIDEIDAVGRKRGSGMGGGHDEKEQTLNQLLVEMDGFTHNEGVVVLAATNRPDILDPALLRPGRFDRQVNVGAPDVQGREDILKVHTRNKKLDGSVDLKVVAKSTPGFTGADLSNLMNEAAILAARENRMVLNMQDINEAMMKMIMGPAKKSRISNDLKVRAVHEAGHAVSMYYLPTHDPVRYITIIPRGQTGGTTWTMPAGDFGNPTRNQMFEQIVGLLGGRVAEAILLSDISSGASNDIKEATKLAKNMVARYGMCENLGTVSYLDDGEVFIGRDFQNTKSYSEKAAAAIDDEVKLLIDRAYDHCMRILSEHTDKLNQVTEYLLEKESLTGEQFAALMEGRDVEEASATAMFDDFREQPANTPEETGADPEEAPEEAE